MNEFTGTIITSTAITELKELMSRLTTTIESAKPKYQSAVDSACAKAELALNDDEHIKSVLLQDRHFVVRYGVPTPEYEKYIARNKGWREDALEIVGFVFKRFLPKDFNHMPDCQYVVTDEEWERIITVTKDDARHRLSQTRNDCATNSRYWTNDTNKLIGPYVATFESDIIHRAPALTSTLSSLIDEVSVLSLDMLTLNNSVLALLHSIEKYIVDLTNKYETSRTVY